MLIPIALSLLMLQIRCQAKILSDMTSDKRPQSEQDGKSTRSLECKYNLMHLNDMMTRSTASIDCGHMWRVFSNYYGRPMVMFRRL